MPYNGNSMQTDLDSGFLQPSKNYNLVGFTAEKKRAVLDYLRTSYNISQAIKISGMDRGSFYLALRNDPAFKQAVNETREQHLDDLEQTMFNNGKTEKGTADRIFALKSWRKERYGDKTVVEHSTKKTEDQLFEQLATEGKLVNVESASYPEEK